MRAVDVFGLAVAVLIALVAQIVDPFSQPWWAAMIAAGVIAAASGLHIAWNNLPKSAQALTVRAIWRPTGYLQPWIGWVVVAAIVIGAFAASHGYLKFNFPFKSKRAPVLAQKLPEKVTPQPTPKSWVTSEEREAQEKLGHTLLNYSPGEFSAMEALNQDYKAYVGQWVKINYLFVRLISLQDKTANYLVVETTNDAKVMGTSTLYAYFDQTKWASRLLNLRPNDKFVAFCQFDRVEHAAQYQYGGTTIFKYIFIGRNCMLP